MGYDISNCGIYLSKMFVHSQYYMNVKRGKQDAARTCEALTMHISFQCQRTRFLFYCKLLITKNKTWARWGSARHLPCQVSLPLFVCTLLYGVVCRKAAQRQLLQVSLCILGYCWPNIYILQWRRIIQPSSHRQLTHIQIYLRLPQYSRAMNLWPLTFGLMSLKYSIKIEV